MKKIVLTICVLFVTVFAFVGCAPRNIQKSSSMLDISSHLGEYDESADKAKMAEIKEIEFAKNGMSEYYILADSNLQYDTMESCKDLSNYLNKIVRSTDQFKVVTSKQNGGKFISIGDTIEVVGKNFDKSSIKYDGYMLKTDELGNFYLLANEEIGLSNGIYSILENIFGCMFVRDDFDYIPHFETIYLDRLDILDNPDFEWRKIFQYEVSENNWFKKLKNNGASGEGVEVNSGWGTWCHSVFTFVDPKIYAKDHPEYFVFVNGEPRQLCLTNPDIYPIVEKKMEELMQKQPDKKYWDFSLNDNYDYCKCTTCAEVLEKTGSMMGTMLPILNKLAKRFPDKMISTLAYFYNKTVPQGMFCEENVNIVVAPIGTGQLYTYKNGDTKKAKEAQTLISDWGKVAKSVFVWDYIVNFSNLLLPFPNFDVQKDNHDFYIANNVKAIFHQGSREHTDELACLRSYVFSKQIWDNSVDTNKLIAKYLQVTYGKAAPYLAEYLDTMNREVKSKAKDLDLYDDATWHAFDYLSNKNISNYINLIDNAIESEKDNIAIVDRLQEIKINVLYARMMSSGVNIIQKKEAFEEFKILASKFDIQRHTEVGVKMDEFITTVYPKKLNLINWSILAITFAPIIASGIVFASIIVVRKLKKKKIN